MGKIKSIQFRSQVSGVREEGAEFDRRGIHRMNRMKRMNRMAINNFHSKVL